MSHFQRHSRIYTSHNQIFLWFDCSFTLKRTNHVDFLHRNLPFFYGWRILKRHCCNRLQPCVGFSLQPLAFQCRYPPGKYYFAGGLWSLHYYQVTHPLRFPYSIHFLFVFLYRGYRCSYSNLLHTSLSFNLPLLSVNPGQWNIKW